MPRVIRAGFVPQDAVALLVAAGVLLGEGGLVVPAQDRVTGLALIQDGLEFAPIVTGDMPTEQVGRPLGAADQDAQLTGASKPDLQRRRALEDDIGGQLHLRHAVAVARSQRLTLSWTEDGHQPMHPVITAALDHRSAQAIGGGLERAHIRHA